MPLDLPPWFLDLSGLSPAARKRVGEDMRDGIAEGIRRATSKEGVGAMPDLPVTAVHFNPSIERWEFCVGSEVWGDYASEVEALGAQADFEQQAKEAREQCQECGGTGTHPLYDLRACFACGGSGKDCSGMEVRHGIG